MKGKKEKEKAVSLSVKFPVRATQIDGIGARIKKLPRKDFCIANDRPTCSFLGVR